MAQKNFMSPEYCRIECPLMHKVRYHPIICSSSFALAIRTANISVIKLKKIGEIGSPYLSPFLCERNLQCLVGPLRSLQDPRGTSGRLIFHCKLIQDLSGIFLRGTIP
jgi:hypothetical protein